MAKYILSFVIKNKDYAMYVFYQSSIPLGVHIVKGVYVSYIYRFPLDLWNKALLKRAVTASLHRITW